MFCAPAFEDSPTNARPNPSNPKTCAACQTMHLQASKSDERILLTVRRMSRFITMLAVLLLFTFFTSAIFVRVVLPIPTLYAQRLAHPVCVHILILLPHALLFVASSGGCPEPWPFGPDRIPAALCLPPSCGPNGCPLPVRRDRHASEKEGAKQGVSSCR